MYIQMNELAGVVREMEDALDDGKHAIAVEKNLQVVSSKDLHFFDDRDKANAFQEFNQSQGKEILVLPLLPTYAYIETRAFNAFSSDTKNAIRIDLINLAEHGHPDERLDIRSELENEIDSYDWNKVIYEPKALSDESLPFASVVDFNRLEFLIESLSEYAQKGEPQRQWVENLTNNHWKDKPMENEIVPVLEGRYSTSAQTILNNHKK